MTFDPVFTGIFNDENNIDIIENFLSVYLEIPLNEIKGHVIIKSRKIESKPKNERKKEVDLVVDIDGKKLNIEMNNNFKPSIVDRNVVFICKIHGGQLKAGDNTYKKIGETLQINLNTSKHNEESLVESYYIRNEKGKILSKKFRIDVVDIERAKNMKYKEREEKLARWLRAFISVSIDELEKELGDDLMEKESREKLLEEVERYSEDEEIYDMYKYHSKQELIQNTLIDEAKEEGFKEGIEKNKIEIAKNLLKKGISIDDIIEITGLPIEEVKRYSEDEEIYDMYKYHSKQELIQNTLIDEAKEEGVKEGIEKNKIEIAKNLLNSNVDIDIISKSIGLSIDEIENLK